jgi:uncharacterized membrane protein
LNVTIGTVDFFGIDWWTGFDITFTRVCWTVAFVLFSNGDKFRTKSVSFFTHWWSGTFWSGFTFTVDDVVTTFIIVGITVNWNQVLSATVWIVRRTTFGFSDFDGFVFSTVVGFTFVSGFNRVTNIDFGTIFQ